MNVFEVRICIWDVGTHSKGIHLSTFHCNQVILLSMFCSLESYILNMQCITPLKVLHYIILTMWYTVHKPGQGSLYCIMGVALLP